MSITQELKTELISEYRQSDEDTGSSDVQVAILTQRIRTLTEHLKIHKKDHAARRGLLKMVGRRAALLKYTKKRDLSRYLALIQRLGIRGK
jgi:small subunit ribosomal protein S15